MYRIINRVRDDHSNERVGFIVQDVETGAVLYITLFDATMIAKSNAIVGVTVSTVNGKPTIVPVGGLRLSDIPEVSKSDALNSISSPIKYKIVYKIKDNSKNTVGFILYNTNTQSLDVLDYEATLKLAMARGLCDVGYVMAPKAGGKCWMASKPNSYFDLDKVKSIHQDDVGRVISEGVPYHELDRLYNAPNKEKMDKKPVRSSIIEELDREFLNKIEARETIKNNAELSKKVVKSDGILGIFNAFKR